MRIGLLDIDCHAGKKKWGATVYPNIALGKLAAWHRAQGDEVEWAMPMIEDAGFRGQFFVYTMLTDDFRESYARVLHWWRRMRSARDGDGRRMVYSYAQPFRDPDDALRPVPQWQKDLAGWVNKKAHFVAHSFEEFEPRKGFRCLEWVRLLG